MPCNGKFRKPAVRMASGFVAERFDIAGRGVICEGNFADLVIIDRAQLRSHRRIRVAGNDPLGVVKTPVKDRLHHSAVQLKFIRAFEDFYFQVCNMDYQRMSKAMDALVDMMT